MMRYLLILCFGALPTALFAQVTIDADFPSVPLPQVLTQLEQEHQLVFTYTQGLVANQIVDASFQNQPLDTALAIIFRNTNIEFQRIDQQYIILKRRPGQQAPERSICGRLVNAEGEPLPYATIALSSNQGTSTEEDGTFRWRGPLLETDTLLFSYVGYQPQQRTVAQLRTCPDILLPLQAFSFSEVLVKEYVTRGIRQSNELEFMELQPDKIAVVPGLTEADVLQMVQLLPGIQSQDESASRLNIRGGTPDQNLILWDGIPIYNSGHFFGMLSAFNPYIVDDVKVYRSGFGASYGGRVAGVIDISSRSKVAEQVKINAGLNFMNADASVELPLVAKKSSLLLSARRAYTDIIESPTYKKLAQRVFTKGALNEEQNYVSAADDLQVEQDFVFSDLNAKWLWQANEQNQLSLSFFSVTDKLDYLSLDSIDNFSLRYGIDTENRGLSATWQYEKPDFWQSKVQFSYTQLDNDFSTTEGFIQEQDREIFTLSNEVKDFSVQWNNQLQFSEALQLDVGYQFSDIRVDRAFGDRGGLWANDQDENILHSGYLMLIPFWQKKLRLNAGLRWNYVVGLDRHYVEPRLSLHYLPSKKWQFKAALGRYNQFVAQLIEPNNLGLGQELWALSDADNGIPVVTGNHYSAGILFHNDQFQVEVETYYKQLSGLTSFSTTLIEPFADSLYAEGSGRIWGLDVLLKRRWKHYETWLSYTYSRVKYNFDIYNEEEPFPASHDRPHSLTFVQQFNYKRWYFSLSWRYTSGRWYTPSDGILIVNDEPRPNLEFDRINALRLPVYHRLDASILYNFRSRNRRGTGMAGLSFLNLYNRNNFLSREYFAFFDDEEEEYQLSIQDRLLLKFTPNVVFRVSWK
ncbi:MAG: TonB-dependent receptor [Bacteroidota bacterium]